MCGIFGIINKLDLIGDMSFAELMKHRGPDAFGSWKNENVLFEHKRLSIIDLSTAANQPFIKIPGYVLVYNGEIFNFMELRNQLKLEFNFATHSDTEVLYYFLVKYRVKELNKLNGMFAFAFYDFKKQKVYLVRDRYGIKPLYYYKGKDFLIFSSEQKSIYAALKNVQINQQYLPEYLAYKYIAGKNTLVKDVYELEPGRFIEYDIESNTMKECKWYEMSEMRQADTDNLVDTVENCLKDSVVRRLISDVPVGLQLSGGIDSSIIAKIVADTNPGRLRSYSIGFPESIFDESAYAFKIASLLGVEHTAIDFTLEDFLNIWELATYHNDEPINHPHSLPIFKLTRVAAKDVTVLLSGEGADEVFLGYEHYKTTLADNISAQDLVRYYRFNSDDSVIRMLDHGLSLNGDMEDYRFRLLGSKLEGKITYDLNTHLNTLLNRIDKMSMANSMEIRIPFLDYRLVSLGFREKKENLLSDQFRKKPLMDLYERYFKDGLSSRRKVGFRVPFDEWLSSSQKLRDFMGDYIAILRNDGRLQRAYIEQLLTKLHVGLLDNENIKEAWTLVNYSIWKKQFHFS